MVASSPARSTPPDALPLSRHATSGFLWSAGQMVSTKGVNMLGQMVLAWLLAERDFGIIALAYAIHSFVGLVRQTGAREILIKRQHHFDRWATPVFWIQMTSSLTGMFLLLMAGPIAAAVFENSSLIGIMALLALTYPLEAASVVSQARLNTMLRFRSLAIINVLGNALLMVLTVVFAALGFGAYSFVLPRPLVSALQSVLFVMAAGGMHVKPALMLRRWRFLIGDAGLLFAITTCHIIITQGDYVILGYVVSKHELGLYFFAFNLSTQTVQMLTMNLSATLYPLLTKITDPQHQLSVFLRATRLAAAVGIPLSALQAVLGASFIAMIYGARWDAAVPYFVILSISMGFNLVGGAMVFTIFQAQGRFYHLFIISVVSAVGFLALVAAGAWWQGVMGVCIAVLVYFAIQVPVSLLLAARSHARVFGDVFSIFAIPLSLSAVSFGLGYLVAYLVPGLWQPEWLRALVVSVIASGVYAILLRRTAPRVWQEIHNRLSDLGRRIARKSGAKPEP